MSLLCMVRYIILLSKVKLTGYSTRSVQRTVSGKDISFDMEPKLPKMQNLAGHISDCKGIVRATPKSNSVDNVRALQGDATVLEDAIKL